MSNHFSENNLSELNSFVTNENTKSLIFKENHLVDIEYEEDQIEK